MSTDANGKPLYEFGVVPPASQRPRVEVDPITLRVVGGAFKAIAREMAHVLYRMSYSSVIRESEDLGAGLFDIDGREFCESESSPMHIGSLPWYIRGVRNRLGDDIRDGDVIVHNDPYHGASHSPDVGLIVPVFWDGELLAFSAVTAHMADVGGAFPGVNSDAYDVFAEAKLYRAIRWYREGELNVEADRMMFDNVRTETFNRGDTNALLAGARLGRERLLALFERWGSEQVLSSAYYWMDYSENMLRNEISKIPDGVYTAPTGWLDDDAKNRNQPLRVETKVIVSGDEITLDLTGSSAEVPTAFNVPFEGSLMVGAFFAIRTLLLDEVTFPVYVPQNEGVFRPVKVVAPKGSLFNPNFPRACFSRFNPVQRVVDNVLLALRDVLPRKVTGGNSAGIHFISYSGFVEQTNEYWIHLEINEGASGGRYGKDGMDSVDNLMANTRNNPIEELELKFPVQCDQYELRPEPPAPGQWRGGIGIVRRNRFLKDGMYACEGDRHYQAPVGIFGGWDGLTARVMKNAGQDNEMSLPAKITGVSFAPGEYVEIREPNGGGYGNPFLRDPDAVRSDVLDEYFSADMARDAYGVVLGPAPDRAIDWDATKALRNSHGSNDEDRLGGTSLQAYLDHR